MSTKTEILRPNGSGFFNDIALEVGAASPNHYLNVDEVVADNATTMVYENAGSIQRDTYNLTNTTLAGTIEKIVLHGKFMMDIDSSRLLSGHEPQWSLYTNGQLRDFDVCNISGPAQLEAGIWTFRQSDWKYDLSLNPVTGLSWTKAVLDSLQLGCGLLRGRTAAFDKEYCTQLWVVVHYEIPTGSIWIEGTGGQGGYLWVEGTGSGSGHLWIE